MYDIILAPTDGSEFADRAVRTALRFARRFDASIHAMYVLNLTDVPSSAQPDAERLFTDHGEETLTSVSDLAENVNVDLTTEIVRAERSVHDSIISYARDHECDLIVMGSHGRTGIRRVLLGSVAARTIRKSPIPVLTIKQAPLDHEIERILVPTDGSEGARAAAKHAIDLAKETEAALHVIHAVDVAILGGEFDGAQIYHEFEQIGKQAVDDVVGEANRAGIRSVEATVVTGRPSIAIPDYAEEREVDLIVIGTHGKSGLDRWILGSVAESVVRTAEQAVLTVNVRAGDGEHSPTA